MFFANEKGHSWSYSTPNIACTSNGNIMAALRLAADITSRRASTEVGWRGCWCTQHMLMMRGADDTRRW